MNVRDVLAGSPSGQAVVRQLAAELIRESVERGDLDSPTVSWAAGRLLQAADEAEHYGNRAKVPD